MQSEKSKKNTNQSLPFRVNKKSSIVRDSVIIRKMLHQRMAELELTARTVVEDARSKGQTITRSSLSRYLNYGNAGNALTEENIIWMCLRYGIDIKLYIGKPQYDRSSKKIKFILAQYNEEQCLNQLSQFFPYEIKQEVTLDKISKPA